MNEDKTCSVSEILMVIGISKATLYKYVRNRTKKIFTKKGGKFTP